jgi:hypothetical protein
MRDGLSRGRIWTLQIQGFRGGVGYTNILGQQRHSYAMANSHYSSCIVCNHITAIYSLMWTDNNARLKAKRKGFLTRNTCMKRRKRRISSPRSSSRSSRPRQSIIESSICQRHPLSNKHFLADHPPIDPTTGFTRYTPQYCIFPLP